MNYNLKCVAPKLRVKLKTYTLLTVYTDKDIVQNIRPPNDNIKVREKEFISIMHIVKYT